MSGETEQHVSGWTVDTLHQYFQRQLEDLQRMLDERYATQVKAVDAAFLAQQTAMQTALSAAEKAVETALLSAEKAVGKAEAATEKRFESVNEFRAQLADQTNGFLPREVADTTFTELRTQISALTARVDRTEGGSAERRQTMQGLSTQAQLMIGVAALIVTVLIANGVFS